MDKKSSDLIINAFAILGFLMGGSFLLAALSLLFIGSMLGAFFLSMIRDIPVIGGSISAISVLLAFVMLLISLFYFYVAMGLWQRREWARVAVIIVSVVALFNFPHGTLLGVFAIWFFSIESSTKKRFKKRKR